MILNKRLRKLLGTNSEIEATRFTPPVFITGCMRSGTTMLVNKLTQHPQLLKIGGELNDVWTEIGGASVYPLNEYKDTSDLDFSFSNNMTSYYVRSIEDAKSFKRHIMRYVYKRKTGGGRVFYDWKNLKVVNKSPHFMNKLNYLHGIYPGCKLILIVRPIHEQVSSLKMHFKKHHKVSIMPVDEKQGWSEAGSGPALHSFPDDFQSLPLMWLRLNKIALENLSSMPKDDYFIIRYEDFVSNQGAVLSRLFDFLKLEKSHLKMEKKIIGEKIKIFNTSTSGNPQKKWEKHLSGEEKKIIASVLEEYQSDYKLINEFSMMGSV